MTAPPLGPRFVSSCDACRIGFRQAAAADLIGSFRATVLGPPNLPAGSFGVTVPYLPYMDESLPQGYLRLEEAAKLAEVSEKTIRNWADQKRIGKKKWKGLALYREEDIRAQVAKQAEVAIVQNPYGPPVVTHMGSALAAAIGEQFSRILPPAPGSPELVAIAQKPRLTLREAVGLGFHARNLVARVKSGTLENVGSAHRYRFRRRDLDAL